MRGYTQIIVDEFKATEEIQLHSGIGRHIYPKIVLHLMLKMLTTGCIVLLKRMFHNPMIFFLYEKK